MTEYLPPVVARLVAETDQHDQAVRRSATVWEQAGRRMQGASRDTARQTSNDSRRAADTWTAAAGRMRDASGRFGQQSTTSARQVGNSWNAAAQRWQNASGQFVSGANRAGAAMGGLGGRAGAAGAGMRNGGAGAAFFAAKLLALASAAGLAGGVLAGLPALASGLAGMASVVGGSFFGIGAALKGYAADQKAAASASGAGASAAQSSARAIRDAHRQIADAQRQQARTARNGAEAVEAAAERVEDAKRAEARAYRAVQDAIRDLDRTRRDAAESVANAERRYTQALREVTRAEEDLDDARREAIRTLADLQERVSDLALDQEGAAIAVKEAEKAYQREMISSEATELSREKAAYNLKVAKERLSDIEREQTEAIEENNDAQAKGVEGSDRVLDAKERLADANEQAALAARDQARAEEDAADAIAAAERRVSDAREAAADATRDRQRAERDLSRTIRDAAEANADAARSVEDAMLALADAQEQVGAAGGGAAGGMSQFAEAMRKLTPEGRAFVYKLLEMKELLKGLSATAQRAFLPGLTQMLEDSKVLFPIFDKNIDLLGRKMGDMARQWGGLFKNKQFQDNLDKMMANSVPIVQAISDGLMRFSQAWVELGANSKIAEGMGALLTGLFEGLAGLLEGLNAHGDEFADGLKAWGEFFAWILPMLPPILAWFINMGPWTLALAAAFSGLGIALKGLMLMRLIKALAANGANGLDTLGSSADRNEKKVGKFGDTLRKIGRLAFKGGLFAGGAMLADELTNNGETLNTIAGNPGAGDMPSLGESASMLGQGNISGAMGAAPADGTSWGDVRNWPTLFGQVFDDVSAQTTTWSTNFQGQTKAGADGAGANLSPLPERARAWFGGMKDRAVEQATQLKDRVVQKATELKDRTVAKASELVSGFVRWVSELPGRARDWFNRMKDAAIQRAQDMVNWFRGLPGRILSSLGNLGSMLWNSGVQLVSGFWDGLVARWNQMVDWLWGAMDRLRALWPFSPAKVGPFSGSGYVTHSGEALTRDFGQSIRAGVPGMIASAREAVAAVHRELGVDLGLPGATPTSGVATGRGGAVIVENHFHIAGTVLAERELMQLVRLESSKYASRNTGNGLGGS